MKVWTQAELDRLISCTKSILDPMRKQWKMEHGHKRNDFTLESPDHEGVFPVYVRVNEKFEENFSIGLDYQSKTEPRIHLLRCNGMHERINKYTDDVPHCKYHIHKVRADLINEGNAELAFAEITKEYAAYGEALPYFLKIVNVLKSDISKHFPFQSQTEFKLN
jgi:hypothetical protein